MTEPTEYLRLSYSSLNTFSSCPRKFEFDKMYPKRVKDDQDWYAADVGSALHAGYQDYLIHKDKEQAIWVFMQAFPYEGEFMQTNDYRGFDASLATLEEMFNDAKMTDYDLAKIKRPLNESEREANAEHTQRMLAHNDATTPPFPLGGVVVPAIEVPFEIRFKGITLPDGRGVSFTGYLDAILQNMMTGMFRTMDIKTGRVNTKDSTPKFKFNSQQVPYGIIVDHLAQGEVESFEVLYLDCYIDLLEPRVALYPFLKNKTDINEWCINKVIQIEQLSKYIGADYFPRTDSGCLFYQSPCRYIEPCISREKESLIDWFLMGEEAAPPRPFEPWVVADIEVE